MLVDHKLLIVLNLYECLDAAEILNSFIWLQNQRQ